MSNKILAALMDALEWIEGDFVAFKDCSMRPDGSFSEDDNAVVGDYKVMIVKLRAAIDEMKGVA